MTNMDAGLQKETVSQKAFKSLRKFGVTRIIIVAFLALLFVLAGVAGLRIPSLLSNVLLRTGFNAILVLAMLPGIQCGIGLNMGMTVGIVGGLLSTMIALEYNMTGWGGFLFAISLGALFGAVIGYLYSIILNKLKGQEMTVSTYFGFAFVALMCIFWTILPFKNPSLTWAIGSGLRLTHNMTKSFGALLNEFLAFKVAGVTIPTGLYLFLALACFLMWLFQRSKTGLAMNAAGANPRFAEATGINVNRMRIVGTMLSTVIAAIGIVVYSQGYGFMQIYNAPKQMGFIAASAILIGGASTTRARISHVILGCFLFQGILTLGMPVANALVPQGNVSEIARILISNGIILYALTKSGGAIRE